MRISALVMTLWIAACGGGDAPAKGDPANPNSTADSGDHTHTGAPSGDTGDSATPPLEDGIDSIDAPILYPATCKGVCAKALAARCYEDQPQDPIAPPIHSDCVEDCQRDLANCPTLMQEVLDCHATAEMVCDPTEDQGIGHGACAEQHEAMTACGSDPF